MIMPLEAMTVKIQAVVGAKVGVTAGVTGAAAEQQRSDSGLITDR